MSRRPLSVKMDGTLTERAQRKFGSTEDLRETVLRLAQAGKIHIANECDPRPVEKKRKVFGY